MTTSPPGTRAAAPAAAPAASSDDAADNAPPASPCLPIPLLGRFAASPFAECLVNYIDEEGRHPDWGLQNVLGLRTVHFETCGRYALASDAPAAAPSAHSHHPAELRLARRLAAEWGALLSGVDVWQGDESDHALRPYFAAAAAAATAGAAPRVVTEALVRDVAFGGALDPRYRLVIKPIPLPPTAGGGAAAATAAAVTASPHDGAVNPSPPPAHTEEALDAGFMVFRQRTLNMSDHFVETEHSWRDGAWDVCAVERRRARSLAARQCIRAPPFHAPLPHLLSVLAPALMCR